LVVAHRPNVLTEQIIGAAIEVHRELGPGMLESAYEACLVFEPLRRNLSFERQKALPLVYKGQTLDAGYRVDVLVEQMVVVEVKCVVRLDRVHFAQPMSYLRITGCQVGLLLNFNVAWLSRGGIKRIVRGFREE
jgi:GxxExxY protein